ncbi:hypothetical protein [Actinacidiphila rubida]|uniref:Uncharacterized protein n=1 Tax=Actinacidiphila rubida TaxID=310780 RepID=A0A1H8RIX3_9ACTN|nr:hypothetical protein [Actinacidiphila rubida]SEO66272.1 hypothetical protein SAMN05216267_103511 [Actinacidiphila rubida]
MRDSEFVRRVIGILTEAKELRARLAENPDRDDVSAQNMRVLLNELVPDVALPAGLSPAEVSEALSEQLGPVFERIAGVFSLVFLALADVHDSGRTDLTSADVLQDLALRADELWPDDE